MTKVIVVAQTLATISTTGAARLERRAARWAEVVRDLTCAGVGVNARDL
jgi:hypothetical protein